MPAVLEYSGQASPPPLPRRLALTRGLGTRCQRAAWKGPFGHKVACLGSASGAAAGGGKGGKREGVPDAAEIGEAIKSASNLVGEEQYDQALEVLMNTLGDGRSAAVAGTVNQRFGAESAELIRAIGMVHFLKAEWELAVANLQLAADLITGVRIGGEQDLEELTEMIFAAHQISGAEKLMSAVRGIAAKRLDLTAEQFVEQGLLVGLPTDGASLVVVEADRFEEVLATHPRGLATAGQRDSLAAADRLNFRGSMQTAKGDWAAAAKELRASVDMLERLRVDRAQIQVVMRYVGIADAMTKFAPGGECCPQF